MQYQLKTQLIMNVCLLFVVCNLPLILTDGNSSLSTVQRTSSVPTTTETTTTTDETTTTTTEQSTTKKTTIPTTTTTIMPTTTLKPVRCARDWIQYDRNCYRRFTDGKTWHDAKEQCNDINSNLLSITNAGEHAFVTSFITTNRQPSVWIGLKYIEPIFQWSDGSDISFVSWSPYLPSTDEWKNKSCGYIKSNLNEDPGFWSLSNCSRERQYICKSHGIIDGMVVPSPSPQPGCTADMTYWRQSCYWILDKEMHALNSTLECLKQDGALVDIKDLPELYFLKSFLYKKQGSYFWTGLNQLKAIGVFQWSHGEPLHISLARLGLKTFDQYPISTSGKCTTITMVNGENRMKLADCIKEQHKAVCKKTIDGAQAVKPWGPTEAPFGCKYANWTLLTSSQTCIKHFDVEKNWDDANEYCQHFGAYLVSSTTFRKESQLFTSANYWIGKKEVLGINGQVTVYFSNGTSYKDSRMTDFPGEVGVPVCSKSPSFTSRTMCLAHNHFICEMNKSPTGSSASHPIIATEAPLEKCDGLNGTWFHYNGYCYKHSKTLPNLENKLRFETAQENCQKYGANLFSLHHISEVKFVIKMVKSLNSDIASAWMGLSKEETDQTWRWSDGSPVNLLLFYANRRIFASKVCSSLQTADGSWYQSLCHYLRHYICKKPSSAIDSTSISTTMMPNAKYECPKTWTLMKNRCLKYFTSTKSHSSADRYCKLQAASGNLVSIHDRYEQDIVTLLSGGSNKLWIGLNDKYSEGVFTWTDRSDVTFTNWATSEPNDALNYNTEDCVEMMQEFAQSHWNDVPCGQYKHFVCQQYAKVSDSAATEVKKNCSVDGFISYNNSCYGYFGQNIEDRLSFHDAQQSCSRKGGNLVSIHNQAEQVELKLKVIPQHIEIVDDSENNGKVWIGFKHVKEGEPWFWNDRWIVNYTNWGKSQPVSDEGNCAAMKSHGMWYSTQCWAKLAYICKITDVQPPRLEKIENLACPNDSWIDLGGRKCYKFINSRMKMRESHEKCKEYGGNLISIHSKEESDVLSSYLGAFREVWIGLIRTNDGRYLWYDQTPMEYSNLGERFTRPNKCIYVDRDRNMKWYSTDCSYSHFAACSVDKIKIEKASAMQDDKGKKSAATSAPNYGLIIGMTLLAIALVIAAAIGLFFAKRKYNYMDSVGVKFERNHESEKLSFADK